MLINKHGELISTDELNNYAKIIFYGASTRNKAVIDTLGIRDKVRYVVDSNEKRQGEVMDGYDIKSLQHLRKEKNVLILTVLTRHVEDILGIIKEYGNHECAFYLPGEGACFKRLVKENEKVIRELTEKRYIHIFSNEKFLIPFYSMLEENFNINEHLFVIDYTVEQDTYGVINYSYQKNMEHSNILIIKNFGQLGRIAGKSINCNHIFDGQDIYKIFDSAKKIILHSLFFSKYTIQFIQSLIKKMYGGKIEWMCWGGDSFYDADSFVVTEILQKIGASYVIESETSRISQNYKINIMPIYAAPYCYISSENGEKGEDGKLKDSIHIMLGHSAAEYGNHEYGLESLYKYCSQNMKIYSPLSYGSDTYRNMVIKKGNELFGDKFIPMVDFMKLEEYYTFLDTIDIAVFPMTRGAAGTTLAYLNSVGKKIYMNKEMISIYEGFNIQAEDIKNIANQKWEEFIENKKEVKLQGVNDGVVSEWRRILNN